MPLNFWGTELTFKLGLVIILSSVPLLISACAGNTPSNGMTNSVSSPLPTEKRAVKHALGEIEVPVNPQRIVVLDTAPLDTVLALGIKPIGAAVRFFDEFPAYLREQTEGITIVGPRPQPNLEKILLLKPDLILSNALEHQHIYDKLSQIAPTFLTETRGSFGNWKEPFLRYGEVLGRKQKAEELLSKYNSRVVQLRQQLGDELANTKVSLVGSWNGNIGFLTKSSFPGSVLDDVGLARPPAQNRKGDFAEPVSRETPDSINGDVIFLLTFASKNRGRSLSLNEFTSDPLFSQLKAVKQGRVYEVDAEVWGVTSSIQAANGILDDLFKYLVEQE